MLSKHRLTTIEDMMKYTVQLNGLLIPVKTVESTLSYYTHPLVVWNADNDIYPCSLMESCIGVYYRNRYLLLCTRHQLKNVLYGRNYEDVGLLDKDGHSFCSAGRLVQYNNNINDVVLNDLAVFDFTDPCEDRPHMKERFFRLDGLPPAVPAEQVIGLVVSGYPLKKQDYGFTEEIRKLGFAVAPIICSIAPDQSKEDSTVLKLMSLSPLKFDLDGMSGGAAFALQLVNGTAHAHLAGTPPIPPPTGIKKGA